MGGCMTCCDGVIASTSVISASNDAPASTSLHARRMLLQHRLSPTPSPSHLPPPHQRFVLHSCLTLLSDRSWSHRLFVGWKSDRHPSQDPIEFELDVQARNLVDQGPKLRSWNGQGLVKVLPCHSCRGRGYILCPQCHAGNPDVSCQECHGKGLKTCLNCLGERVVWQDSLDERPWKEVQSCSPLKVADDEVIDRMDIQLAPEKKSSRVYSSPSAAVREKIRQALKKLNAETGSISKRMKKILSDPVVNAKRIAAIKKAKGTEASRQNISKKLRIYFENQENRLKRSLVIKGKAFRCRLCGQEGHRRHYCPTLSKPDVIKPEQDEMSKHYSFCGQHGHSRSTCNSQTKGDLVETRREFMCSLCGEKYHRKHKCPTFSKPLMQERTPRPYRCTLCGQLGHSKATCQDSKSRMNIGKEHLS